MGLLRGAGQVMNQMVRLTHGRQSLPSLLRHHFSTTADHSSNIGSILNSPSQGVVYAKLRGINVNMQKTDVLSLFDDSKLTLVDIKAEYTRNFQLMSMLVQFPSMSVYTAAFRTLNRKGRMFRLEKADRQEWDLMTPYNGRYVLLQGIPQNALVDDVERFLSGCNYDSSSLEMFTRAAQPDPIRMAKVHFSSQTEATNAVIAKNGGFCLNNRVIARLLH